MNWTPEAVAFLREHYPQRGKAWCMDALGATEPAIRAKAAALRLRQDRNSPFFADWQKRAAESKVGRRRPEHAEFMRKWKRPPVSEATRARMSARVKALWARVGHPRGALGMRHTPEAKERMSQIGQERWAGMSKREKSEKVLKMHRAKEAKGIKPPERPNASWKAGWREFGGKRNYYRSRWEANYARYLEWLRAKGEILAWEHEPKTFWFDGIKRGCVSYLPDFRVTDIAGGEEYHEVKGWMDDRSKTKIKRMAKYHPKVKLLVIATKQYKAIERAVSGLVPGWEQ